MIEANDLSSGRQVSVTAPAGAVLTAVVQVYSDLNIPIGTAQTGSGRIGNVNLRVPSHSIGGKPLSTYLNCGQTTTGNRADQGDPTISLAVDRRRGER